jgi:hypothetical protein
MIYGNALKISFPTGIEMATAPGGFSLRRATRGKRQIRNLAILLRKMALSRKSRLTKLVLTIFPMHLNLKWQGMAAPVCVGGFPAKSGILASPSAFRVS